MTGVAVRWTAEQVGDLAPDEASRRAGVELAAPGPWSATGAGAGAVWGLCEDGGTTPYRTAVDLAGDAGPGCACTCPGRTSPCAHALGLLLLWASGGPGGAGQAVPDASAPPEWVTAWLADRRGGAAERRAARGGAGPGGSSWEGSAAGETAGEAAGEAAGAGREKRSAAARERARRRALRIAAGADELRQRLADLLRTGLAGAGQAGRGAWDETAARMVDAQAPGLAARARELGALPFSGPGWPERLLAECALLHLLAQGYMALARAAEAEGETGTAGAEEGTGAAAAGEVREAAGPEEAAEIAEATEARGDAGTAGVTGAAGAQEGIGATGARGDGGARDEEEAAGMEAPPGRARPAARLPEPLAATVRSRVGLTVGTAEVLAQGRPRVRDEWLVLARRDTEEGRLTARRCWLHGRASGRTALLLSYGAPGRAPRFSFPPGALLNADLAYYPGAWPLRAALGTEHAEPAPEPVPVPVPEAGFVPPGGTVADALRGYGEALRADPWLDAVPAVLSAVVPVPPGDGPDDGHWQLAEAGGEEALPVASGTGADALWKLAAVSGGGPLTVFGECGHRGFTPYTAWSGTELVPL